MSNQTKITFLGAVYMLFFWSTTVAQSGFRGNASNFLYTPQIGNFDNLTESGDISLQIASGALLNIDLPSVRVAFSPIKNIGIGFGVFSFASHADDVNFQNTSARLYSGDIAYYGALYRGDKKIFRWQAAVGYGAGKIERTLFDFNGGFARGTLELGIQNYTVEGSSLFLWKNLGLGIGLKAKYFNYSSNGGFGEVEQSEVEKINQLLIAAPALLLDLNTRIEFGSEFGKVFFSWDFTIKSFEDNNDLLTDIVERESIHLGFYIIVNKAIKQIKIKRNEKN